jgi:hypothetical protein
MGKKTEGKVIYQQRGLVCWMSLLLSSAMTER